MSNTDRSQFQAFHSTLDQLFKSKQNTIANLENLLSGHPENTSDPKIIPIQIQKESKAYARGDVKGDSKGDGQADRETGKPSGSVTGRETGRQTTRDTAGETLGETPRHVLRHTQGETLKDTAGETLRDISLMSLDRKKEIYLSPKQELVLSFIWRSQDGFLTTLDIAAACGLTYKSARNILTALRRHGFIRHSGRVQYGVKQGIRITFNEVQTRSYIDSYVRDASGETLGDTSGQTSGIARRETSRQGDVRGGARGDSISSSLSNKKLTTKESLTKLPEMGFWQVEPNVITARQFDSWLKEFELTQDVLLAYLDRCRYEMVELGKEADLKKGSAINWFYGVMKKRGGSYPEPQGYKSLQELKLEEEKRILEKNESIMAEMYEVNLKKEFSEIMEDTISEKYKACMGALDKYSSSLDKKGPAFRAAMWETFKKFREEGSI